MIVKPSIQFLNLDNDDQLASSTETILTRMTGNLSFLTPEPPLLEITAAKVELVTAMSDAAGGGVALTAIKNAKRATLVGMLRRLAIYVQVSSDGDMPTLLSSGFPIQKPQRQPVGVLPAPSILAVGFGARTGELHAVAGPLVGASIYNWRLTTDAAPDVVLQTAQTTAASNTFTGLTLGVVYSVEANAVGAAGPSDWSVPVPQMAV